MRYFSQLVVIGVILGISAILYPGYVYISDMKTLIVATVTYGIASMVMTFVVVGMIVTSLLGGQFIDAMFMVFFSTMIVNYLSLVATEIYVSGFEVSSTEVRMMIAFVTAVITSFTSDRTFW